MDILSGIETRLAGESTILDSPSKKLQKNDRKKGMSSHVWSQEAKQKQCLFIGTLW